MRATAGDPGHGRTQGDSEPRSHGSSPPQRQARVVATAQVTTLPDGTVLIDKERVRLTPIWVVWRCLGLILIGKEVHATGDEKESRSSTQERSGRLESIEVGSSDLSYVGKGDGDPHATAGDAFRLAHDAIPTHHRPQQCESCPIVSGYANLGPANFVDGRRRCRPLHMPTHAAVEKSRQKDQCENSMARRRDVKQDPARRIEL